MVTGVGIMMTNLVVGMNLVVGTNLVVGSIYQKKNIIMITKKLVTLIVIPVRILQLKYTVYW